MFQLFFLILAIIADMLIIVISTNFYRYITIVNFILNIYYIVDTIKRFKGTCSGFLRGLALTTSSVINLTLITYILVSGTTLYIIYYIYMWLLTCILLGYTLYLEIYSQTTQVVTPDIGSTQVSVELSDIEVKISDNSTGQTQAVVSN